LQKTLDARDRALAALSCNKVAFHIPSAALSARNAVLHKNAQESKAIASITLVPYEREARARRDDVKMKMFGLQRSYEE